MSKTMAEVLVAHTAWATTNPDGEWLVTCVDCKATIGTYDGIVPKDVDRNGGSYDLLDAALAAHQAAALSAAGFGPVQEAKAQALREAADDFEGNVGVGEFEELSMRDGGRWKHIAEAWEYQGPYMDWLRNRAEAGQ